MEARQRLGISRTHEQVELHHDRTGSTSPDAASSVATYSAASNASK
jgi:hypothetical protein